MVDSLLEFRVGIAIYFLPEKNIWISRWLRVLGKKIEGFAWPAGVSGFSAAHGKKAQKIIVNLDHLDPFLGVRILKQYTSQN